MSNKTIKIEAENIPETHPVTVEFVKKLELRNDRRYILFIDSKNLILESAQDLANAMAVHGYNVSIVLTDGDPNIAVIEYEDKPLPKGSVKVEARKEK